MGCVKAELQERVLEWTITEVELQDFVWSLSSVAGSSLSGLRQTFEFFKLNKDKIDKRCGEANMLMQSAFLISLRNAYLDEDVAKVVE